MTPFRLSLTNVIRRPFRSGLIIFSVVLIVTSAFWATLIIQTIEQNLQSSLASEKGLGADIVVVPRGSDFSYSQPGNIEFGRLLKDLRTIPGVSVISPQLRLFTLKNGPFSSEKDMFIFTFEQVSDFTVQTWLKDPLARPLGYSEAIVGSSISLPPGSESISLAGMDLKIVGQLLSSDTTLDQSVFVTFETGQSLAINFQSQPDQMSGLEPNYVPAFMVKVSSEDDPQRVANQILMDIQGVTAFESANFFQSGRVKLTAILDKIPLLFAMMWLLSELFIGVIFALSVNERKRELGVLRALGSTRRSLLQSILNEGRIVSFFGGVLGIFLGIVIRILFGEMISRSMQLQLMSISPLSILGLSAICLFVAFTSVGLASLYPVWVVNQQDPAVVLRG